jgi:hypothetical protein
MPTTPRRREFVQFPIADTPDKFAAAGWHLKEVHADHVDLIESFQPYPGRTVHPDNFSGPYVHPLAMLRDLSNADKHRVLTPVILTSNEVAFENVKIQEKLASEILGRLPRGFIDVLMPDIIRNSTEGHPVKPGAEVLRARLDPSTPQRCRWWATSPRMSRSMNSGIFSRLLTD